MNGNIKVFMFAILFVGLVSLACESATSTPQPHTPLRSPVHVIQQTLTPFNPTNAAQPTYTMYPTYTEYPTNTPSSPSSTQLPDVIYCYDIVASHDGATDIQWQEYKREVRGRNFYFSANVSEVYDNNTILLVGDGCGITLYNIPRDTALSIHKDQWVEGYGTIRDLSWFLWSAFIDINVILETLIIR